MERNERTGGVGKLARVACLALAATAAARAETVILTGVPQTGLESGAALLLPLGAWSPDGAGGTEPVAMPMPPLPPFPAPPGPASPWLPPLAGLWAGPLPGAWVPPLPELWLLLPPLPSGFGPVPPLPPLPGDGWYPPPLPAELAAGAAMRGMPQHETATPEPGTLLLAGSLLAALAGYRFLPSICHSVKGERAPRIFTSMQ